METVTPTIPMTCSDSLTSSSSYTGERHVSYSLLFPGAILTYHRISRTKKNSKMCEMVTDTSDSFTISHSFTTISVPGGAGEREREFEQERERRMHGAGRGRKDRPLQDVYMPLFTLPQRMLPGNTAPYTLEFAVTHAKLCVFPKTPGQVRQSNQTYTLSGFRPTTKCIYIMANLALTYSNYSNY